MGYRTVDQRFWTDPKVRSLSNNEKLLFLYFITSPNAHYSGVYYCPISTIEFEIGLKKKDIIKGIDTLSDGYHIRYDMTTNEVFVVNMAKFQMKSAKQIKGVERHFEESVQSQLLRKEFCEKYDRVSIPYRYPIDTTERERERESTNSASACTDSIDEELFENLWKLYPNKKGKSQVSAKSKKAVQKLGVDHFTRTIDRYKRHLELETWKKPQNGSTFFNGGYLDYIDDVYADIEETMQKQDDLEREKLSRRY